MHSTRGKSAETPYSPSAINRLIKKQLLDQLGSFWVAGEVLEHFTSRAGHQYFTIKDNQAGIRCVLFQQKRLDLRIQVGMHITLFGQASIYEPKGDLQLLVSHAMETGLGTLEQQRQQLINELKTAGMLEPGKKRNVPEVIERLGIVSSPDAAGLKDVLDVLLRKNPLLEISLFPTLVQGSQAAAQMTQALKIADQSGVDVILLCRGGGSKEDLWCFNDRELAWTLAELTTPTITAIGHETDESVADLVADLSCITPTAAAEHIGGGFTQMAMKLQHQHSLLALLIRDRLRTFQQSIDGLTHQLQQKHPKNAWQQQHQTLQFLTHQLTESGQNLLLKHRHQLDRLQHRQQQCLPNTPQWQHVLDQNIQRLHMSGQQHLNRSKHRLEHAAHTLNLHNPLNVLSRGYSITTKADGSVLTDVATVKNNDQIETRLKSGRIRAKIFERIEDDAL